MPFTDLICVDIDSATGCFLIQASFAARLSAPNGGTGAFRLTVDGTPVPSSGAGVLNTQPEDPLTVHEDGAIIRRVSSTPGMHTVCLQWSVTANASFDVAPVAFPDQDHASLVVCDTNCGGFVPPV